MEIYLLEDNHIHMERLENAIEQELNSFGKDLSCVQSFDKPDQLLTAITTHTSDQLFFLDIETQKPELKGIDVAKHIRDQNAYATIVFVTSHQEFMPLTYAYGISAYNYIDKSLEEEDFRKEIGNAIAKLHEAISVTDELIFDYDSESQLISLPFDHILYIETSPQKHNLILHGIHNRMEFRASLKEIKKSYKNLIQPHRSYLVNPNKIIALNKHQNDLTLIDGTVLPVSRTKLCDVEKVFENRRR